MRVIAGKARSLPLKTPEGVDTRPTTDRVKETLFNMLQADLPGCVFVDLFSGSGAVGIEALSRGAEKCYFIENNGGALSCIRDNLTFTRLEKQAIVIKQDAAAALAGIGEERVDIIFMDPPYEGGQEKKILALLGRMPYVHEETIIIAEALLQTDFEYAAELGFTILREKKYKTNKHVFLIRR